MGIRAREMSARLRDSYEITILYRQPQKVFSAIRIFFALTRIRPPVSYVFDISYSAILAVSLYKLISGNRLIVETGDAIAELVRSTGSRSALGVWLTDKLEDLAFRVADRVVVRGTFHKHWLFQKGIAAEVIQDGVDIKRFQAPQNRELRNRYGLQGLLTIGLLGSSVWSTKLQLCYGWDLVEVLRLLKDQPVKGIMIGDGSGIAHLKSLCHEYNIEDKILFLGHVAYEQLPSYLNLIDVCLSTQTNDVVGQVRTTGKLPLYLASGRYVLASKVGEAAAVLDANMLVDYDGVKDEDYPRKLSERIRTILQNPQLLGQADQSQSLARKFFDYDILAKRLGDLLAATIAANGSIRHVCY